MNATGCARSIALDVARVAQVDAALQPLEARRLAAGVERDDFAVEQRRPVQRRAAASPSARTIAGNCDVLSLPSRDQRRTSAADVRGTLAELARARGGSLTRPGCVRGATEPRVRAAISTSARMPSYFGSKTRADPMSGGSASVASIGRAAPDFSRQITEEEGKEGPVDYRVFGD